MFVPRLRRSFSGHPYPGLTAGPSHFRPFGPFDQGQCASAEGAAAILLPSGPSGLSIKASAQAPKARQPSCSHPALRAFRSRPVRKRRRRASHPAPIRPFGPFDQGQCASAEGAPAILLPSGPSGLSIKASAQAPKARQPSCSHSALRALIKASAQAPKARQPSCSHSALRASRSRPVRKRRRRASHPAPIRPFGPFDQGQCASAEGAPAILLPSALRASRSRPVRKRRRRLLPFGPSGLSIKASAQAPKARQPSCSLSALRASRSRPVRKRRRRGRG